MATARRSVTDFIAQVNAQTNATNTYVAALQASGSVKITKNGTTLFPNVLWAMGTGSAVTDLNISGDSVTLSNNDGTTGRGDAQLFINSLT